MEEVGEVHAADFRNGLDRVVRLEAWFRQGVARVHQAHPVIEGPSVIRFLADGEIEQVSDDLAAIDEVAPQGVATGNRYPDEHMARVNLPVHDAS